MVRSVVKPSLRTASCCMVDVVNGAAGLRLRFFFSMGGNDGLFAFKFFQHVGLRGFVRQVELFEFSRRCSGRV